MTTHWEAQCCASLEQITMAIGNFMNTRLHYVQKTSELNNILIFHQIHEKTMMLWHKPWLYRWFLGKMFQVHLMIAINLFLLSVPWHKKHFSSLELQHVESLQGLQGRWDYDRFNIFSSQDNYTREAVFPTYRWGNYIFRLLNFLNSLCTPPYISRYGKGFPKGDIE